MSDKTYTVGEILRLGLLKNHLGKPYKHKGTVLSIVKRLKHERIQTPWGLGYDVPLDEIKRYNKHESHT